MGRVELLSVSQAVRMMCDRWPIGQKRTGRSVYQETMAILVSHGSPEKPLDATVLRRFREVKDGYGIHPVKPSDSVYIKEDPALWRHKVIHQTERAQA